MSPRLHYRRSPCALPAAGSLHEQPTSPPPRVSATCAAPSSATPTTPRPPAPAAAADRSPRRRRIRASASHNHAPDRLSVVASSASPRHHALAALHRRICRAAIRLRSGAPAASPLGRHRSVAATKTPPNLRRVPAPAFAGDRIRHHGTDPVGARHARASSVQRPAVLRRRGKTVCAAR